MPKNPPHPFSGSLLPLVGVGRRPKCYAKGGRNPAHPKVEPLDKIKPATIYPLTAEDMKDFSKYEKVWKEIFKLR